MEMVIKIDSQAFLASLQDVVRQIQAGCTQVTWQVGMQATEPTTPIHTLTNEEHLEVAGCPETEPSQSDNACQITSDTSISHSELTYIDSPSGTACQTMTQQANAQQTNTPHGSDVAQSAMPTTEHVSPTSTLTPQVLIQSATAMLQGNVAGAETSYTLEGVRARLAHLMRRGEGDFVKAVLACYGATRLTQVAPKHYQEIMQKVGEKDAM